MLGRRISDRWLGKALEADSQVGIWGQCVQADTKSHFWEPAWGSGERQQEQWLQNEEGERRGEARGSGAGRSGVGL
jgi:hypothetical protein